ncbi:hypothetical protein PGT21_036107 [Puccinia graminis f. sp. tritici]|uniref:Uncharacterized protein n=1 Tax=Puccinia graminis f. sp. tritici TaxID=56615 RepID=A0A5B0P5A5_PUCGR|nr:hypothetical protein PGT21_036107 [Puccinia graminis f. sp. tritici]
METYPGFDGYLEQENCVNCAKTCSFLNPVARIEYSELCLKDLLLKKPHATHPWRPTMLINQGKNDSTLTDALTLEFNCRYPSIKFYHLFPGYIQTNAAANWGLPFPIPQLGAWTAPFWVTHKDDNRAGSGCPRASPRRGGSGRAAFKKSTAQPEPVYKSGCPRAARGPI